MKLRNITITLALFYSIQLFSQTNCTCNKILNELIEKIEKNYPGFNDKVKNKVIYSSFKKELLNTSKITELDNCKTLLNEYITYFKDGHIYILSDKQAKNVSKKIVKTNYKKFKKIINKKLDSISGIWRNDKMIIGIINEDNIYKAFHISSKKNQRNTNKVLFTIDKDKYTYYFSNQNQFSDKYSLRKDTLKLFTINSVFIRDNHEKLDSIEIRNKIWNLEGFYFKKLTDKTSMIKIKGFNYSFVDRINTLIAENTEFLENSKNLIIDLRDNSGGTTLAATSLYPYILTNDTKHFGSEYYSTTFLIHSLESYLKRLKDEKKNKSDIERISNNISKLKRNLGKFVTYPNEEITTTTKREIYLKSPKQIVILANKNTGSAAENFLFTAKQSKKVKVLGAPTYGALDYASARVLNFNCKGVSIVIPTNRNSRLPEYPIDNIGIQPDIYLDETVKDWIKFSIDYLEN